MKPIPWEAKGQILSADSGRLATGGTEAKGKLMVAVFAHGSAKNGAVLDPA